MAALERSSPTYIISQHDVDLFSRDTKQVRPVGADLCLTPPLQTVSQSNKNLLLKLFVRVCMRAYTQLLCWAYLPNPSIIPFCPPSFLLVPFVTLDSLASIFMPYIHNVILCICIKSVSHKWEKTCLSFRD